MKIRTRTYTSRLPWRTDERCALQLPVMALTFALAGWWVVSMASSVFARDESRGKDTVTDANVTRAITGEFWGDDKVDANTIDVTTRDGVVKLSGTADSILAKERAAKIAEATVGVRAVVNTITVRPAAKRSDAELESSVLGALARDPATESYEVAVKANGGVVTLTGTVDSWQEKQLASIVAKSVGGVTDVKNEVTVSYDADRPDIEIRPEIEARLANDVLVDDLLIDVEVKDGDVFLTGAVGSLEEKNRAATDAWVGGVKSVDASGLDIEWWARDKMRRKSLYQTRPDEDLREAVVDAFLYDPRVFSFEPNVHVLRGTVTLTGVVDNLKAKRAAEEDAKNVVGVRRVKNYLRVRPVVETTNEKLKDKVEQALLTDPYLERWDVTVDVYYGTVYLSGDVHTSFEKDRAEEVVEGIRGVTTVVNHLDYQYQWEWKPDWEIAEDVEEHLFWSIHVQESDVEVEVDDGVVTLTGDVDSWGERRAAERNAYEAGAKDVRNLLTVSFDSAASALSS